jgi:hypothetical protein
MTDQPERRSGQRWILSAFFIFIMLLLLWIAAAIILSSASAGALPFSFSLNSRLAANYKPDEFGGSLGVFRLSIIDDALLDDGLSPDEAGDTYDKIRDALGSSVPTATARNFEGDDPYTATVTETQIPIASLTSTQTPRAVFTKIPSATPTNTRQPAVVVTSPPTDTKPPNIVDPGILNPPIGTLGSCSQDVYVSNAQITDASPSSGINWVKLKYKVYDDTFSTIYAGYIYSNKLNLCSGGPTANGGWDACYDGPSPPFTIRISPGFSALPPYSGPGPFKIKVWIITQDNAGYQASYEYGYYTMPESCDDPSVTNTSTVTPMPTDTPTTTASPTITATRTNTSMPTDTPTQTNTPVIPTNTPTPTP